ncbi:hypothetical protein D9757_007489 [Collybiopsis confluens]|uniref:Zn(2)-C6 fungal-type domain-containing protein n=1 Tax=Collybiopsis confluens TaxID=2823264 RepID=A0A8H5HJU0_9AGAR|nr:hypothetical protein D9757_007489 [Collybiopsis confluens]
MSQQYIRRTMFGLLTRAPPPLSSGSSHFISTSITPNRSAHSPDSLSGIIRMSFKQVKACVPCKSLKILCNGAYPFCSSCQFTAKEHLCKYDADDLSSWGAFTYSRIPTLSEALALNQYSRGLEYPYQASPEPLVPPSQINLNAQSSSQYMLPAWYNTHTAENEGGKNDVAHFQPGGLPGVSSYQGRVDGYPSHQGNLRTFSPTTSSMHDAMSEPDSESMSIMYTQPHIDRSDYATQIGSSVGVESSDSGRLEHSYSLPVGKNPTYLPQEFLPLNHHHPESSYQLDYLISSTMGSSGTQSIERDIIPSLPKQSHRKRSGAHTSSAHTTSRTFSGQFRPTPIPRPRSMRKPRSKQTTTYRCRFLDDKGAECGSIMDEGSVDDHVYAHLPKVRSEDEIIPQSRCWWKLPNGDVCGQECKNAKILFRHVHTHHNIKVTCPYPPCIKQFSRGRQDMILKHLKTAHGFPEYPKRKSERYLNGEEFSSGYPKKEVLTWNDIRDFYGERSEEWREIQKRLQDLDRKEEE